MTNNAVVLLSSGMDSVVAFKKAFDEFDELLCLTFDYGQRACRHELKYSAKIAAHYGVSQQVIKLPWLSEFDSALTATNRDVPTINSADELDNSSIIFKTAEAVWVPARNMVFLSIAASFAENYGYGTIVTGFDCEEAFTFPDNSVRFVELFNKVLEYGTLNHPVVYAPLQSLSKVKIVKLGMSIDAPFQWSWSCYNEKALPCGVCESCMRRKRAFDEAGFPDPFTTLQD
ncbi:MAG: 7-cyano-7-deazaguanine synthase [Candidatus Argoarchaeum ethanivorans]|uniref:7-cyano-7-deazaguanine synthase n=1 Tax=Candidatus Argoarchaeum ethanivorans TaxID=2608793 RepID=A0A8B3SAL9_9EURY|nr:MAG: 7-cyano-7-deazaguanine synthase [Candidatus Argoarchaeum ethanivorans]